MSGELSPQSQGGDPSIKNELPFIACGTHPCLSAQRLHFPIRSEQFGSTASLQAMHRQEDIDPQGDILGHQGHEGESHGRSKQGTPDGREDAHLARCQKHAQQTVDGSDADEDG